MGKPRLHLHLPVLQAIYESVTPRANPFNDLAVSMYNLFNSSVIMALLQQVCLYPTTLWAFKTFCFPNYCVIQHGASRGEAPCCTLANWRLLYRPTSLRTALHSPRKRLLRALQRRGESAREARHSGLNVLKRSLLDRRHRLNPVDSIAKF